MQNNFGGKEMPRHTVTLPDAARKAAHDFEEDPFFDFSSTNAHGPPSDVPPVTLPPEAMVPANSPPNGVLPDGAATIVPMDIPPRGMGEPDLPVDVPWWLIV